MKRRLILNDIKDFTIELSKQSMYWIGTCSTFQQTIFTFVYSNTNKFTNLITKEQFSSCMYYIISLGILIIVVKNIHTIFKKEFIITVNNDKEHKIIIKIGNYEDNMEDILKESKKDNKDSLFIIGINNELSMSRAERRGVHKSVMDKFYNDDEKCTLLQSKVNKVFNKKDETLYEFESIGIVTHDENSKILFVVNSMYEDSQSSSILGPQPGGLIKNIFNHLEKQSVDIVQIPILSSRNVRCVNNKIRFSVTIAEIIEHYFQQLLNEGNIDYNLVLSIRREDLKENLITINSIVKFIKDLKPMYHIK